MFSGRRIWLAYLIVFVSSTCGLVIELLASRIMAPHIGVSLYTWTTIIGVVLAGMSLGNYLGGVIADRRASRGTLSAIFLAAGLSSASILVTTQVLASGPPFGLEMGLVGRILVLTVGIFFLPSFVLGTVTPVVIKLALQTLQRTGSTVGSIYAFSTVGSIFGTFLTGFWLISWLGTRATVWLVVAVLLATSVIVGQLWRFRRSTALTAAGLALCLLAVWLNNSGLYSWLPLLTPDSLSAANLLATVPLPLLVLAALFFEKAALPWSSPLVIAAVGLVGVGSGVGLYRAPCEVESSYFCIKANETLKGGKTERALVLDHLVHSYVTLEDPTVLGYGYEQVYAELTAYHAVERQEELDTLFIGGGGYTFPRYVEVSYPRSSIDVIEIDPAVTQFVRARLGLSADSRIRSYHDDARSFLMRWPEPKKYDIIYGDAFNDFSVPYHLTTVEFNRLLSYRLKDDGLYLANIIDRYRDGEFAKAFVNSLRQVFPYVHVCVYSEGWRDSDRYTFVALASHQPFDVDRFLRGPGTGPAPRTKVVSDAELDAYLRSGRALTLTDDFVPVDQLLAPLFAEDP